MKNVLTLSLGRQYSRDLLAEASSCKNRSAVVCRSVKRATARLARREGKALVAAELVA